MGALNRDIPQFDVHSIIGTIRRRWWLLPLCMLVAIGAMIANESNLQTSPASVTVTSLFEARDETLALGIYGINPTAVAEYPSFQTQVRIITEKASRAVESALGQNISIAMSKTSPQVSLINAPLKEDGQQFTVLSIGASNYEFRCDAATEDLCDQAVKIYIAETVSLRKTSLMDGMTRLADQIAKVEAISPSPTLQTQRTALMSAAENVTGDVSFVSSKVETFGPTIRSVNQTTYLFGSAAGLLVAMLIMLQLAIIDRKVRSASRLISRLPHVPMLGELIASSNPSVRHLAAALVAQSKTHGVSSMLLIPASGAAPEELAQLASAVSGLRIVVGKNIDEMSVDELSATPSACVVVATKNETDMQHVERTQQVLRQAGNNVVGMMLIAAHD